MTALMDAIEPTPVVPHLSGEFLLWLWWSSDRTGGSMDLGEDLGRVDFWVDSRLAFRAPGIDKAATVLTGENPSAALEARAAIAGGKILQELRLAVRHEDKEFFVTLKAPHLDFTAVRLPQVVKGDGEEALYDRMFLYEELNALIAAFFALFSEERRSPRWGEDVVSEIREWIMGEENEAS